MRLLTWLRRFFPDDQNRLSAYGDLVEEYEALTRMGGRAGHQVPRPRTGYQEGRPCGGSTRGSRRLGAKRAVG